jgi:DNA gyrase inhibitor GyrI
MEYKIENIPALKIAFIRKIGPYGSENSSAMEQLKAFAIKHDLFDDSCIIFGIAWDNPECTSPEKCRYDVGLVVADDFHSSDNGINTGMLEGGKYAVFTVKHTAEDVQKAWTEIFRELVSNGIQINLSKPAVERYAAKMIKEHKCEICVPII